MKMSTIYYNDLQAIITRYDSPVRRDQYRNREFPRAGLVVDLDKRYRWDLFWIARRELQAVGVELPSALDDSHIDTALRSIVRPLSQ